MSSERRDSRFTVVDSVVSGTEERSSRPRPYNAGGARSIIGGYPGAVQRGITVRSVTRKEPQNKRTGRNGYRSAVVSGCSSSAVLHRCTQACNCVTMAKHRDRETERKRREGRERERFAAAEPTRLEITAVRKAKETKEGRGRAARNIHLEYRRRRTGCGLARNAHLERIALSCVKGNPLRFLCQPTPLHPLRFPFPFQIATNAT